MSEQIIGIKQLHQNLKQITDATMTGQSFLVVKNSKPAFRIEPVQGLNLKKYTLKDFKKLQFKSANKNLSKNIDKILYN
ncbi:hypothetical protein KJ973_02740 [Patescibacteria group bacterium]|nr:hypothetical protein [Patescibacteria group bacterium]